MFTFEMKNFEEDVRAFAKHDYEKNYKKGVQITFVCSILILLSSIIFFACKEELWISISSLVVSLLFMGFSVLMHFSLNKGRSTVDSKVIEQITMTFNKDNIESATKYKEKGTSSATNTYEQIVKVEETEDYFFLYLSKISAYVVKKDRLVNGSIADFRKFLRKEKKFEIIETKEKKSTKNRQRRRQEAKK